MYFWLVRKIEKLTHYAKYLLVKQVPFKFFQTF